jgi:hypothetical protein
LRPTSCIAEGGSVTALATDTGVPLRIWQSLFVSMVIKLSASHATQTDRANETCYEQTAGKNHLAIPGKGEMGDFVDQVPICRRVI